MKYFQGFVIPVKTENKLVFLDMAKKTAPIFDEYGALRTVECWGDDVMAGKITDFRKAVQAHDDETIVLSWICWPDKATPAYALFSASFFRGCHAALIMRRRRPA